MEPNIPSYLPDGALKQCGIHTVAMEATGVYWVRREVASVIVLPRERDKTCCPINSTLRGGMVR